MLLRKATLLARGRSVSRSAPVVADLAHRARADRGWLRITVDPDLHNESGIRFWQAVGFAPDRAAVDETGRSPYLLMVLTDQSFRDRRAEHARDPVAIRVGRHGEAA